MTWYRFAISRSAQDEVVLAESRSWDGLIAGGTALAIIIAALIVSISKHDGVGAILVLVVAAAWCLCLLVLASIQTEASIRRDRIQVVRSVARIRLARVYMTNEVRGFRVTTAPMRGSGGKGLSMLMTSGRAVKITLWSRSQSLDAEVLQLTRFLVPPRAGSPSSNRR